ncbi:hypothetical protein CHS0354_012365 [Potamilus streckersoni]|uniref:WAP four-disulfide core domain protein 1 n=1 Tax=Potamilus streckersoni TaxID=2493646 RepID=A0AAE0SJQ4_9BIVA|nr:hypothetical protein CHS0354_012365 [Potamilus streckersoni]
MSSLCILVILVIISTVASKDVRDLGVEVEIYKKPEQEKELWVEDMINYKDDYISDGQTVTGDMQLCPPIPDVITDDACVKNTCESDSSCKDMKRCCFNGCVYVCMHEIQPAPVIDWIKEPQRSKSGVSWLISGPRRTTDDMESCSTSPVEEDEDPLLCPHGYVCHIENPGNPKKGIPNRGYCVKEISDILMSEEKEEASGLRGQTACLIDNYYLLDGAVMVFTDKNCRCRKGVLSCVERKHVPRENGSRNNSRKSDS